MLISDITMMQCAVDVYVLMMNPCLIKRVIFKFRCSGKSNNGTDVNAGQIPQLLYKIASSSNSSSNYRSKIIHDQTERVLILSRSFTHSVSSVRYSSACFIFVEACFRSHPSLLLPEVHHF